MVCRCLEQEHVQTEACHNWRLAIVCSEECTIHRVLQRKSTVSITGTAECYQANADSFACMNANSMHPYSFRKPPTSAVVRPPAGAPGRAASFKALY